MKKFKLSLLASALVAISVQAQEEGTTTNALNLPEMKAGECNALVVVPAKFEPRTEQVLIKEEVETITLIPAEYEWVEEQVEIKPATKRLEVVPATYRTVEEEFVIEPESMNREVIPPQFSQVAEQITARPAHRAIRSEGGAKTFSSMGEALRVDEVPAKQETVNKQVVQEKASIKETPIPAKTTIIKKQVIDKEAQIVEVEEPAQYQTVKVKKLVTEAKEEKKLLPAEYAEVTVFEKVSDAEVRWESVLCNDKNNGNKIEALQRALQAKGYNVGGIDGALGKTTLRAIEKYQKDNNLAVGGVTEETLKSLGIE